MRHHSKSASPPVPFPPDGGRARLPLGDRHHYWEPTRFTSINCMKNLLTIQNCPPPCEGVEAARSPRLFRLKIQAKHRCGICRMPGTTFLVVHLKLQAGFRMTPRPSWLPPTMLLTGPFGVVRSATGPRGDRRCEGSGGGPRGAPVRSLPRPPMRLCFPRCFGRRSRGAPRSGSASGRRAHKPPKLAGIARAHRGRRPLQRNQTILSVFHALPG